MVTFFENSHAEQPMKNEHPMESSMALIRKSRWYTVMKISARMMRLEFVLCAVMDVQRIDLSRNERERSFNWVERPIRHAVASRSIYLDI